MPRPFDLRPVRSARFGALPAVAAAALLACAVMPAPAAAQIRVHPDGVNVNSVAETVVFLTYGGVAGYEPIEAVWCREIEDAFPHEGLRCVPGTILGSLPGGFDLSGASGANGLTDIMTIPRSVARRAYEAAAAGGNSEFFYVRRFRSLAGGPDVFVPVTCRMAGGGARVPFALVDVVTAFQVDVPVLAVRTGEEPPPLHAEIRYNGTGLLRGRWEVVLPGDEPPELADLLTEGTLPAEQRPRQRIYQEVGRFAVFLPPSTQPFRLEGPDPARLPTDVDGPYQVLLRVEATADKEGDSNLGAAGAGEGIVHSGGVAPFPIPPLRYWVGNARTPPEDPLPGRLTGSRGAGSGEFRQRFPEAAVTIPSEGGIALGWTLAPGAAAYRVEVFDLEDRHVLDALVGEVTDDYRLPPWVVQEHGKAGLRWRIHALDAAGGTLQRTPWRAFRVQPPNPAPPDGTRHDGGPPR